METIHPVLELRINETFPWQCLNYKRQIQYKRGKGWNLKNYMQVVEGYIAGFSRPSTLETDQSTVQLYLCPEFLKKSHLSGNLVKRLDRNTFKEDHNLLFSIA